MNTYDFDKTIFYPDSSACFYKYCLRKHSAAVLKTLPKSFVKAVQYAAGKIETKELKEQLFSFLQSIENIDAVLASFWKENMGGIGNWYLEQKRDDDIIISASPYFLLEPIIRDLGIKHLMASNVDKHSGKYNGINCHGKEKVRRFYEVFPDGVIEDFYSDSLSDSPLAEISKQAFMVKDHNLLPWPEK